MRPGERKLQPRVDFGPQNIGPGTSVSPQDPQIPPHPLPGAITPGFSASAAAAEHDTMPQYRQPPPIMRPGGLPYTPPQTFPQGMSPIRMDPMVRPLELPSRGVWYHDGQCPKGQAYIVPMRGAQDEVFSGVRSDPAQLVFALREVTKQCSDLQGLPFEELLIADWMALLINVMLYSLDSDEMPGGDPCPGCKTVATFSMQNLSCKYVRIASTVTPKPTDALSTAEEDFLRAMDDSAGNRTMPELTLSPEEAQEPFTTPELGQERAVLAWRQLRLKDLSDAEEFAKKFGTTDVSPNSKLDTFLLATQITHINGEKALVLQAMEWVRRALSSTLRKLRREIDKIVYGYSMTPIVRCKNPSCGRTFRSRLPIDGSLFRSLGG